MKKRIVYIIQGYEHMTPEGQLSDVTYFEVYATSETEAIDRAKKYSASPKKFYRLERVIETFK